jgi:hypothetical protein
MRVDDSVWHVSTFQCIRLSSLFSPSGMLGWAVDTVQMWWRGEQYKYSCLSWDWSPVAFALMSPPWLNCPWCHQRDTAQITPQTEFLSLYFDCLPRRHMRTDARCALLPFSYRLAEISTTVIQVLRCIHFKVFLTSYIAYANRLTELIRRKTYWNYKFLPNRHWWVITNVHFSAW